MTFSDETSSLLSSKKSKITGYSLFFLEVALFSNTFLAGFDATVTAATYATISNALHSASLASWITTAYLLTFTSFLSLYGSFSDVLGRRTCFFFSTIVFGIGCLACGASPDMVTLIVARAVTGVGGAGLTTMATIINSDVISADRRAMYQAFQNMFLGIGNIVGASTGGFIAEIMGWRWCFYLQIPFCIFSLIVGNHFVIDNNLEKEDEHHGDKSRVDISGSIVLVIGLVLQLVALSLGGNQYEWSDFRVIGLFLLSGISLAVFFLIELNTKAVPIVPISMLTSSQSIIQIFMNLMMGLSQFAYTFVLPLKFQVVLGDSPSKAGLRLLVPSVAQPIGAFITGIISSKYDRSSLKYLVIIGALFMLSGYILALFLSAGINSALLMLFLAPANLGLGMAYPAALFTYVFAFDPKKQAVATSITYLLRGLGAVWGVAASSSIVQSGVANGVFERIRPKETAEWIIGELRDSISVIDKLNRQNKTIVVDEYDHAMQRAFVFSIACCFVAVVLSFLIQRHRNKF